MALLSKREPSSTPRQREILGLLARGGSNKEIAEKLGITEQGVKSHISRMLARHGATNRTELVAVTRAWTVGDAAEYAGVRMVASRMREDIGGDEHDERDGGHPPGAEIIGRSELSARVSRLSADAGSDVRVAIERLRKVVVELNIAIDLARELPVDATARGIVNAVRKRASEAERQLAALEQALTARA